VIGTHSAGIKVKLRAAAVEGKANAALRNFVAEQLNLPKRAIRLERGSQVARQAHLCRRFERGRDTLSSAGEKLKLIERYSVITLSAHSISETKILGLPNFAPYSARSTSVTPRAREHAPHA